MAQAPLFSGKGTESVVTYVHELRGWFQQRRISAKITYVQMEELFEFLFPPQTVASVWWKQEGPDVTAKAHAQAQLAASSSSSEVSEEEKGKTFFKLACEGLLKKFGVTSVQVELRLRSMRAEQMQKPSDLAAQMAAVAEPSLDNGELRYKELSEFFLDALQAKVRHSDSLKTWLQTHRHECNTEEGFRNLHEHADRIFLSATLCVDREQKNDGQAARKVDEPKEKAYPPVERNLHRQVPRVMLAEFARDAQPERVGCWHCGKVGHHSSKCWDLYPHMRPAYASYPDRQYQGGQNQQRYQPQQPPNWQRQPQYSMRPQPQGWQAPHHYQQHQPQEWQQRQRFQQGERQQSPREAQPRNMPQTNSRPYVHPNAGAGPIRSLQQTSGKPAGEQSGGSKQLREAQAPKPEAMSAFSEQVSGLATIAAIAQELKQTANAPVQAPGNGYDSYMTVAPQEAQRGRYKERVPESYRLLPIELRRAVPQPLPDIVTARRVKQIVKDASGSATEQDKLMLQLCETASELAESLAEYLYAQIVAKQPQQSQEEAACNHGMAIPALLYADACLPAADTITLHHEGKQLLECNMILNDTGANCVCIKRHVALANNLRIKKGKDSLCTTLGRGGEMDILDSTIQVCFKKGTADELCMAIGGQTGHMCFITDSDDVSSRSYDVLLGTSVLQPAGASIHLHNSTLTYMPHLASAMDSETTATICLHTGTKNMTNANYCVFMTHKESHSSGSKDADETNAKYPAVTPEEFNQKNNPKTSPWEKMRKELHVTATTPSTCTLYSKKGHTNSECQCLHCRSETHFQQPPQTPPPPVPTTISVTQKRVFNTQTPKTTKGAAHSGPSQIFKCSLQHSVTSTVYTLLLIAITRTGCVYILPFMAVLLFSTIMQAFGALPEFIRTVMHEPCEYVAGSRINHRTGTPRKRHATPVHHRMWGGSRAIHILFVFLLIMCLGTPLAMAMEPAIPFAAVAMGPTPLATFASIGVQVDIKEVRKSTPLTPYALVQVTMPGGTESDTLDFSAQRDEQHGWLLGDHPEISEGQKEQLQQVLLANKQSFAYADTDMPGYHGTMGPYRIVMDTEDTLVTPPRRYSLTEKEVGDAKVNSLTEAQIIKQIRLTKYMSAPTMPVKKDAFGAYSDKRFCIDYRRINVHTLSDHYGLPLPEDLFESVGQHRFFSKIDLRAGFIVTASGSGEKSGRLNLPHFDAFFEKSYRAGNVRLPSAHFSFRTFTERAFFISDRDGPPSYPSASGCCHSPFLIW